MDSEYIVWADVSAHPTDTLTLIPFLRKTEEMLDYKYKNIVADVGYESEENYVFIELNGQDAYIKPANYEISKTKKYRTDIGKFENMAYDPSRDTYICRNGKELKSTRVRKRKSGSGYVSESTVYTCSDCTGCPFKTQCIKGNNCHTPMDERSKILNLSKKKEELRKKDSDI
ncbi:MAG: transposase [Anaerolineaceae bacterium]|nr:transposase [Anaerolineaceae bacterium]